MPKSLAIFCDGTWNDLSLDTPTNVVRLAKAVADRRADGAPQIVYYDEGVGVGENISWVTDTLTKYIGGALGRGLDRKIEAAYRFLVLNYEPGDDIYVFGFSRGAYTARSLCGLIRKCGILKRSCFNQTPNALKRYRDPLHPDSPQMREFRAAYAHPVAVGSTDLDRKQLTEGEHSHWESTADLYQYRRAPVYRMMYVGLWDTVGAMGVPSRIDVLKLNSRYAFHDTNASSLLASVRHAVAANEKRGLYDSTPVGNVHELNREWAHYTGWTVDDASNARFVPYPLRPYQQRWFPGDHCSVGGGYAQTGLSSAALLWIAEGAVRAGLRFDAETPDLPDALRAANPNAPLGPNGTGGQPEGKARQVGPAQAAEVADSATTRWFTDPAYRPPNLYALHGAAWPIPAAAVPTRFPKPETIA